MFRSCDFYRKSRVISCTIRTFLKSYIISRLLDLLHSTWFWKQLWLLNPHSSLLSHSTCSQPHSRQSLCSLEISINILATRVDNFCLPAFFAFPTPSALRALPSYFDISSWLLQPKVEVGDGDFSSLLPLFYCSTLSITFLWISNIFFIIFLYLSFRISHSSFQRFTLFQSIILSRLGLIVTDHDASFASVKVRERREMRVNRIEWDREIRTLV